MKQQTHTFWLTSGISLLCLAAISPIQARPIPDATLPVNSTVDTSQDNISTITGGTVAERNLFHSFKQFNIYKGERADFVSPSAAIQNILVRVTGGSRSNIDGTLSTSGLSNPNLFLINPNGIIFGANARLDIGGSFVATTANAIRFGNQGFFSASAPNSPELLTVNPSAFLFNQIAAQPINSIENRGYLSVPEDRSLLLVGGNVSPSAVSTGRILINDGTLKATNGRVELGGITSSGAVGLNIDGGNLRLNFPEGVARADVSLTNGAFVDVVGRGSGSIAINARNLDVLESDLQGGIGFDLTSDGTQAGDITLDATEAMKIEGRSRITNEVGFRAVGNAGGILIKAESLSLADGAELSASIFGQGETKGVSVQANNSVSIVSGDIFTSSGEETGVGNGGDINIQTGDLFVSDDSLISASISREGRAGDVIINARNTVSLENSRISSRTSGSGDGGNIDIKARELSLTRGAALSSFTTGQGKAGNIQIHASDRVNISGVSSEFGFSSGLVTSSEEKDSGPGNNISVTTGTLSVSNGGVLSARTLSDSPGGDITVNVNTLELVNGGQILTSAYNSGPAGNITVNATDRVSISGSDPTFDERLAEFDRPTVDPDGPNSGLFAGVRDDEIAANAGNIKVTARSIQLDDKGTISATTTQGKGGDITLGVEDFLLMRGNSQISTTAGTAQAGGDGGNIDIDTDLLVALKNSDITANAFDGRGGNIQITTQGLFLSPNSDITASSQRGVDGTVQINKPDAEPSPGLIDLPTQPLDTQMAQTCAPSQADNEFYITGRGGMPPTIQEIFGTEAVLIDWVSLDPEGGEGKTRGRGDAGTRREEELPNHQSPIPDSQSPDQIVEAQGWVIGPDGEVILTAQPPNVTPHSSWQNSANCHAS